MNFEEGESSGSEYNSAMEDTDYKDSSSEESESKESELMELKSKELESKELESKEIESKELESKELEFKESYEDNSKSVVSVGMFESDEMSAEIKGKKSKNSTSNFGKHPKSLLIKE